MATAVPPPAPPTPPLLPPPAPRSRRRTPVFTAIAGVVVGVLGTLGVTALLDDGDKSTVTAGAGGRVTTTTGTDEASPASPPTTTEPLPDPTYVSLDEVLYPADRAALRAMLDDFDFPAWWWLPDAVAAKGEPFSTVQSLVAKDTLLNDGVTTSGSSERSTTWHLPTTDVVTVEAAVVAAVPADVFDVEAAKARRSETSQSGRTTVTYIFYEPGSFVSHLYLSVEQVGPFDTTEPDGIEVHTSWNVQTDRPPSAVPTGPGPARAFLSAAPVAGFMRWQGTDFSVTTVRDIGTSGSYEAWFSAPPDEFDRTIAFLADPGNFPGQLKLVQPGEFSDPTFWEQVMAWGDLRGQYAISKPATGTANDLYITLSFPLT